MINGETIGVGIVTCNRPHLLKKLLDSISYRNDCELIIVNDGDKIECPGYNYYFHNNETNLGVGKSKNIAFKRLLNLGCDHIFLIEDDIYIKDPSVFEKYIETSKITGIQHLNFSQHGMMNKSWPGGNPNPRVIIDYGKIKLPLYPHCVGAFSYYSKKCLETAGLIDERYYNACEHVDHTLEIIKKGMHPPFWYFADIENSWEYLGDEEWSRENSTISSNHNHNQMMEDADKIFKEKHGHLPGLTTLYDMTEVGFRLKEIKQKYG
jgi:glycosyltransferase involved in cell wall biosynthesis